MQRFGFQNDVAQKNDGSVLGSLPFSNFQRLRAASLLEGNV
jgi:hypothetical protein